MSALRIGRCRAMPAVAAVFLAPLGAAAQEAQPEEHVAQVEQARRAEFAVRDALTLGRQRQFSAAVDELNSARLACAATTDVPDCENLVVYSLGYIHQTEAARSPGERSALLERAARYYQEVVDADPGYQDAVYNLSLALRELGPQEWQEQYYLAAPDLDPQRRTQHLVFLGDYHAAQERWREAIVAYEGALSNDPTSRAAASALLEAAARAPSEGVSRLLEYTAAWEQNLPDVATAAYGTILRSLPVGQDDIAERAFLRLAVLSDGLVAFGPNTASAASELPGAAEELEAFLYGSGEPLARGSWWLQSEERRRALAEVSLRAGGRWVAEGRPDRAQQGWSMAESYAVSNSPEALDLKRELALLYFRHQELDPTGDRFRELEHEVFLEKGAVLRAADHAAAQRYHTALGLIYAERGEWTGPSARNATDQLTWALETAEVVDADTGGHRPLPEIRALLASGLEEAGNQSAAQQLYHEAALGYLDSDALEEARTAAQRAGETARSRPIREVIAARTRLQGRSAESGEIGAVCGERAIDAVTEAAAAAGDDEFAARQRFKLLSDCAAHTSPRVASAYQAAAFDLVVQQRLPLVGNGDLRRLLHARASVAEAVRLPTPAPGIRVDAVVDSLPGITVSLHGQAGQIFLPVTEEEATGARVVRLLAPAADRLRLQVDAGVVELDSTQAEQISPALLAELSRLEGVKAVRVGEGDTDAR